MNRRYGKTVAKTIAITAVVWDLVCQPGDTLSEVVGEALADRRTRAPLIFAAAVLTIHVVEIAVRRREERADLHLERFEVLRELGWPA